MAKNLIQIFCDPALNMAKPKGMHLFKFGKAISELAWGDAFTVGRHDWVIAGFSVTIQDFVNGLKILEGVELEALSRLMNTGPFQKLLCNHDKNICKAIQERLSGDLVRVPRNDFERLIRTLGKFQSLETIDFLKIIKENYLDEFIQGVVTETIYERESLKDKNTIFNTVKIISKA
jgi:hypothetical protein